MTTYTHKQSLRKRLERPCIFWPKCQYTDSTSCAYNVIDNLILIVDNFYLREKSYDIYLNLIAKLFQIDYRFCQAKNIQNSFFFLLKALYKVHAFLSIRLFQCCHQNYRPITLPHPNLFLSVEWHEDEN